MLRRYDMYHSKSGFFHLTRWSPVLSSSLPMTGFILILQWNKTPLCIHTKFSLSICWWTSKFTPFLSAYEQHCNKHVCSNVSVMCWRRLFWAYTWNVFSSIFTCLRNLYTDFYSDWTGLHSYLHWECKHLCQQFIKTSYYSRMLTLKNQIVCLHTTSSILKWLINQNVVKMALHQQRVVVRRCVNTHTVHRPVGQLSKEQKYFWSTHRTFNLVG